MHMRHRARLAEGDPGARKSAKRERGLIHCMSARSRLAIWHFANSRANRPVDSALPSTTEIPETGADECGWWEILRSRTTFSATMLKRKRSRTEQNMARSA